MIKVYLNHLEPLNRFFCLVIGGFGPYDTAEPQGATLQSTMDQTARAFALQSGGASAGTFDTSIRLRVLVLFGKVGRDIKHHKTT